MTGFALKAYWRSTDAYRPRPGEERLRPRRGGWHCFLATGVYGERRWVALCDERLVLSRSGGQHGSRPPAFLRCPVCDAAEAELKKGKRPDHLTLREAERAPVIRMGA